MPTSIPATDKARTHAQQGFTCSWRSAQQGFTHLRRSAQQGFTRLWRSAQQGFTLLEMLVALAIFSLAALALVRLQAVSVRSAADLGARTMAQIVARNIAYERLTDAAPPAMGETTGITANDGRDWRWTQSVSASDEPRLVAITVRVDGGAGASPAVLTVTRPAK